MEPTKEEIVSVEHKVDPVWQILIKHLNGLAPERYPAFSARKKAVEAMIDYASLKVEEERRKHEQTDYALQKCIDFLNGSSNMTVEEVYDLAILIRDQHEPNKIQSRIAELEKVLRGYEQWEADILNEDKLWWPNRASDVFRGKLYDNMLELQQMRNAALNKNLKQ